MFEGLWHHAISWAPQLLSGARVTLILTIVVMVLGSSLGVLLGTLRAQRIPVVEQLVAVYVELLRGLPAIVLLFIVYFGLPTAGLTISSNPYVAGTIALSLQLGAYTSEVFRAAILAVDPGQRRAATSLGMSATQAYRYVVMPQAFLIALPTLGSIMIGILKETSLLSFISVSDLLKQGTDINAATYLSFQVYGLVGLIYVVLSIVVSRTTLALERRLRHGRIPTRRRASRVEAGFDASVGVTPPDVGMLG